MRLAQFSDDDVVKIASKKRTDRLKHESNIYTYLPSSLSSLSGTSPSQEGQETEEEKTCAQSEAGLKLRLTGLCSEAF
jgi:hypothetical protein